jgi:hypothetical protein
MDEGAPTEEFVITTYTVSGGRLDAALNEIRALDEVVEVGNVLQMAG